jgi:tetratricopeptide (TPR) repeat protein
MKYLYRRGDTPIHNPNHHPRGKPSQKRLFWLGLITGLIGASLMSGCSIFPKVTVIKDPLSPNEHLVLGMVYEKDGLLDLAEREYKLADPLPFATFALGNIEVQRGDFKKAESYYRKVLKEEPVMPEAANNLAFVLLTQGKDLEEAYRLATIAVEESIKQNLGEDMIKNHKNTLNQVETALMRSKSDSSRPRLQGGGGGGAGGGGNSPGGG